MNLADIRKKANQERDVRKLSPGTARNDQTLPPSSEPAEVPEECFDELFDTTTAATDGLPAIFDDLPDSFDPLAILLAGRELAGCREELSLESCEEDSAKQDDCQEMLRFRLDKEEYVVDIMKLKEIIKPRETTEIPHAPSFITGVISLRGIIVPVFDMRLRLKLQTSLKTGKERIIVVKRGDGFCGMLVDEVSQVVKIPLATMESPPAVLDGVDREFVDGIGRFEGKMLIILCLDKVLDASLR